MMWLCHPISLLSVVVATASALPQPSDEAVQRDPPSAVVGGGITCPAMFLPVGDQCLYFGTFMLTDQKGSAQICSSVAPGAHLVSIRTPTQMKKIISEIIKKQYDSLGFWIDGTTDGGGVWNFTSGDLLPMGMPFWAASETIKYPVDDPNFKCAAITHDSGFYIENVDCTDRLSPICEAQPTAVDLEGGHTDVDGGAEIVSVNAACPPFYINLEGTPICTAFAIWASVSWSDARQICEGLQGELFTGMNIEYYRMIYDYLHQEGIDTFSFWIGGSKDEEGKWIWSDGLPVPKAAPFWGLSDTPEHILEPDGDGEGCLAMTAEGEYYFRDKQCSAHYSPLCAAMALDP
ncbi:uncharacterized protein [Palaemon carinicauda]|uniref:uncharacterized protein n=1 Tax=Palaemon carinicauda TaxID=392227 RepID=UPI0035B5F648